MVKFITVVFIVVSVLVAVQCQATPRLPPVSATTVSPRRLLNSVGVSGAPMAPPSSSPSVDENKSLVGMLMDLLNLNQGATGQPPRQPPTGLPPTGPSPTGEFRAKRQSFFTGPTGQPPISPPSGSTPVPEDQKSLVGMLMDLLNLNQGATGQPPRQPPTGLPPTGLPPTGLPPTGPFPTGEFRAKRQAFFTGTTVVPPRATTPIREDQKSLIEALMDILGLNQDSTGPSSTVVPRMTTPH